MAINCQNSAHARLPHHHERDAVNQAPRFILVGFVHIECALKQLRSETYDFYLLRSEEPLNDFNRISLVAPRKSISNFEQNCICNKQRLVLKKIRQLKCLLVILISRVDQGSDE